MTIDVVKEIDFSDTTVKGLFPVVIYSSISKKPNGEQIQLINIEPINNSKEMILEIFGNNNFYKKSKILALHGTLNILSFRSNSNQKYFIKIKTEEYDTNDNKLNLLFYGFYSFEKNIFKRVYDSNNNIELSIQNLNNQFSFKNNNIGEIMSNYKDKITYETDEDIESESSYKCESIVNNTEIEDENKFLNIVEGNENIYMYNMENNLDDILKKNNIDNFSNNDSKMELTSEEINNTNKDKDQNKDKDIMG